MFEMMIYKILQERGSRILDSIGDLTTEVLKNTAISLASLIGIIIVLTFNYNIGSYISYIIILMLIINWAKILYKWIFNARELRIIKSESYKEAELIKRNRETISIAVGTTITLLHYILNGFMLYSILMALKQLLYNIMI